jgi:hypothetical protein
VVALRFYQARFFICLITCCQIYWLPGVEWKEYWIMDYELERMWKEVVEASFKAVWNHVTEITDTFQLSRWPVFGPRFQEYEMKELINIQLLPASIVTVLNCKCNLNHSGSVLRQGQSLKFIVFNDICITICSFLAFRL